MSKVTISKAIRYIGCDDHDIDLFESQYEVPNGVSYNSYLIVDDKIAIMDTAASGLPIWKSSCREERRIIWWYPIWSRIMPPI